MILSVQCNAYANAASGDIHVTLDDTPLRVPYRQVNVSHLIDKVSEGEHHGRTCKSPPPCYIRVETDQSVFRTPTNKLIHYK